MFSLGTRHILIKSVQGFPRSLEECYVTAHLAEKAFSHTHAHIHNCKCFAISVNLARKKSECYR